MRLVGHVARIGRMRATANILGREHKTKKPLGRPRHRREDIIKIYIKECGKILKSFK